MTFAKYLVLAVLVAGCDTSDIEDLCDNGSGVWTLQQAIEEKCIGNANPMFTSSYMESECQGLYEPLFAAGRISLASDDVIEDCRQALSDTPCLPELYKDWVETTAICNDIIIGRTASGAACSVDEECGGQAYCKRTGSCGVCTDQGRAGSACAEDDECQSGICFTGMCLPSNIQEMGPCTSDRQCTTELVCRGGSCRPLADHIGTACSLDSDCNAFQSSCMNSVCTELATPGQDCSTWAAGAGATPHCKWFASAGCIDAKCEGLPAVAKDAACGIDAAICGSGLWCFDSKCYPVGREGSSCDVDEACGPYALCVDRTCRFSDFDSTCRGL